VLIQNRRREEDSDLGDTLSGLESALTQMFTYFVPN
jgi:hypothetical protein